ncbi:anti-adapter protein IraM [Salmonella enterica]|uniref:anti-adapter protein IraM n=1 Tax=Salmonella enterica TaxID=28901 RepID=UPI0035B5F228
MEWTVIDTIACPNTGIVFSGIINRKMLRLTIWYEGDVIIPPGSIIQPFKDAIKLDGVYTPLKVYNVTPFKQSVWRYLKDKIQCAESMRDKSTMCLSPFKCALKVCPHGKIHPHEFP